MKTEVTLDATLLDDTEVATNMVLTNVDGNHSDALILTINKNETNEILQLEVSREEFIEAAKHFER